MTGTNKSADSGTEPIVVAVDGPAGSGKSSVSRKIAQQLGYGYLDTGAAYRALAWLVGERGINKDDSDAVCALVEDFHYASTLDPETPSVVVNGTDATMAIRRPEVSSDVSAVARIARVREHFNSMFRVIVADSGMPGVIVEGRDITTVVFPDASVRILLTADETVRALRRNAELAEQSPGSHSAKKTAEQLHARDRADSRVVDFMNAAEGVVLIDSTTLNFDETVDAVIAVIREQTVKEKA
ncbi:(d)CMP kinase [Lysinibacter sp. HNR]|uniref:(d)CMP kinase n=1 Tax=Lysinibacter sp. HNR TaxID=3031408 RepID=UPI00243493B8|nr:(d)CMP kinase [Lysinibacter sp. HNR]WGD36590.1 (d)CMP kinase [Lysinibacter sp. HNR]